MARDKFQGYWFVGLFNAPQMLPSVVAAYQHTLLFWLNVSGQHKQIATILYQHRSILTLDLLNIVRYPKDVKHSEVSKRYEVQISGYLKDPKLKWIYTGVLISFSMHWCKHKHRNVIKKAWTLVEAITTPCFHQTQQVTVNFHSFFQTCFAHYCFMNRI